MRTRYHEGHRHFTNFALCSETPSDERHQQLKERGGSYRFDTIHHFLIRLQSYQTVLSTTTQEILLVLVGKTAPPYHRTTLPMLSIQNPYPFQPSGRRRWPSPEQYTSLSPLEYVRLEIYLESHQMPLQVSRHHLKWKPSSK